MVEEAHHSIFPGKPRNFDDNGSSLFQILKQTQF